ncbi:YneF family protein [Weissella kandleri]|uniref:YneF family protein n=1 Tax=Weissella kandleri TaxID=1616 RepID=UPI00387E4EB1
MNTSIWIVIVVIAFIVGMVLGFFMARRSMETYLKKNPPISEDMMRSMMTSMGQKPSQKKLNQLMAQMKNQQNN